PLEEITATVTKAQSVIATALSLLRRQLKPLLTLQERVATLQSRINALSAEVDGRVSLSQGGVDAPAMFSSRYVSQLTTSFRPGAQTGFVQGSWPGPSFIAQHGWVVILQAALSLGLALVLLRHRQELEQVEHWRFVATRPIAASLLVGVLSVVVFYERFPDI